MASKFEDVLRNAQRKGITDQYSKDSIDWFRKNVRKSAMSPGRLLREERDNLVGAWTNLGIGRIYFAYYQPKHRDTLPYYDKFPILIPFERYSNGFLSLNLHYLPPILRAKLLDGLYDTLNNKRFDEKTKMKISYGILKGASNTKHFKPCVKRYLGSHFRSKFIRVPQESWTTAVFLPVESFEKAGKQKVWADSRKMV